MKYSVFYWDGNNIVAEQTEGKNVKCYLRGINLIAREMDGMVYYYIHNEHGDVSQIRGENGACKASYEYDAFGNEKNPNKDDENPFRYYGEYYDVETQTVYLRNRDYDASIGRFTQEDTYWNPENMIYGDNPVRLNEREADENDLLGLNTYTYKPEVTAMMQSTNLYVYGINSPICYQDPSGDFAISLAVIFVGVVFAAMASIALMPVSRPLIHTIIYKTKENWGNISQANGKVRDKSKIGRNDKGKSKTDKEAVNTNKGNEIDITPTENYSSSDKNPGPKGKPNSSVDILDKNGKIKTRRWYNSKGNAYRDVDMTNHGNPKKHPEFPHVHIWDWSKGYPIRK